MEIRKFTKKPITIEAVQWADGNNAELDFIKSWVKSHLGPGNFNYIWGGRDWEVTISTLEGPMHVSVGDWIIRGSGGEFYPCKPAIFEQVYEPAGEFKEVSIKKYSPKGIINFEE